MHSKQKNLIFDICLSLCGALGTIGCFLQIYQFPVSYISMLVLLLPPFLYFVYVFQKPVERRKRLIFYGIIAYILIAIVTFPWWSKGLLAVTNQILRVYESNSQYRFRKFNVNANPAFLVYGSTLWLVFTPMIAFVLRSIRERHSYFLAFFITAPFIFSILLFTLRPYPIFFIMVLMFWFALLGMQLASHHKTYTLSTTATKLGLLFACVSLVFMLGLRILSPESLYVRSPWIEVVRARIQTTVRDIMTGADNSAGELDLATAGNRIYYDITELTVTTDSPKTLYLHGFSGTFYEDNTWRSPEEDYYTLVNFTRSNLPLTYASNVYKETKRKHEVTLTYEAASRKYVYTPYFLADVIPSNAEYYLDNYLYPKDSSEDTYTMNIVDYTEDELANIDISTTQQIQYKDYMSIANTAMPSSTRAALEKITIPGMDEAETDEEKIAAVISYVENFGEYTLSPGTTPSNKDFVLYFLNENKRGYCVHYATAATLLLRTHGVMARYAEGYRVDAHEIVNGTASVKDRQAHAWVEVFDPLLGWKPIEVTPAASLEVNVNTNGGGTTNNPNNNTGEVTNQEDPNTGNQTQGNQTQTTTKDTFKISKQLWFLFGGIVLISIFAGQRKIRKARRNRNMHQGNVREGILYAGTYLDRWMKADEAYPENIRMILEEAKFSSHPMQEAQREEVCTYVRTYAKQKIQQASFIKKFLYKYIACLD